MCVLQHSTAVRGLPADHATGRSGEESVNMWLVCLAAFYSSAWLACRPCHWKKWRGKCKHVACVFCSILQQCVACLPTMPLQEVENEAALKEQSGWVVFDCLLAILRVMLNITHDSGEESVCSCWIFFFKSFRGSFRNIMYTYTTQ